MNRIEYRIKSIILALKVLIVNVRAKATSKHLRLTFKVMGRLIFGE